MRRAFLLLMLWPAVALGAAGDGGISGGGTATNKSGTIASASTSQVVMAAKTTRAGCEIQASGMTDVWIAIDSTASNAGGSFFLPAGSLFRCGVGTVIPTGQISIWSATAGAGFTAMEYAR